MANTNGGRINFQVGYNVDQNSVNQVKKSLQDLQSIKFSNFEGTQKQFLDIKNTAEEVERALNKAFNTKLGSLNSQEFIQSLQQMQGGINGVYQRLSEAGAKGQVAFSQVAKAAITTNVQLRQTKSLINSMGQTMANTVKWGIASSIMNNFSNSVQQAFSYVKSLDSALTDIRIVTGDSTQEMSRFADQANRAAQELGRSTMDYTKAALTFYQQGLSDQDVQARTQAVLKAQNITGAGQEMADYLTAVWNGYKIANEEAELYVDKLAAVADSSASNMSQLAIAMSKVASVANSLGVPVDSLNAQIATIVATTRNAPQSVGNALKTIYSRINDISTGAQGAQVSLGNYSKKMLQVGINVLDTNGNLRDTGQVIEQIGGKWESLSREQQIYLARTMAGQRQYNNLIALFDNWNRYTDLVNVSLDSQGSLMQKNSRYLDSLAAHMEQFGAAGERVKAALIDEESLKGIVDLGTNITNIFGSFIESIGGGSGALLNFGSIFTSLFSNTIAKEINNIVTNIQNAKANADILKQDIESTELFGTSQGFQKDTISQMVKAKEAAQDYYQYMDQAQINHYNDIVQEIGAAKQQVLILQQQKEKTEDFISVFERANKIPFDKPLEDVIERASQVVNALQDVSISYDKIKQNQSQDFYKDTFANLNSQFEQLKNAVGGQSVLESLQGWDKYEEALLNVGEKGRITNTQLQNLQTTLRTLRQQALGKFNDIVGLDNTTQQLKQQNAQLQISTRKSNQYLNNIKQFSQIKIYTNAIAGLGQVASSLNNIINLTKVWKNENNTLGEKLLQTFTNLSFTIPMLYGGLKKIVAIAGVQLVSQRAITQAVERRRLEQEKITKQKAYQALTNKIANGDNSVETYRQWQNAGKEARDAGKALDNFNSSSKNIFQMAGENAKKMGSSISSAFGKAGAALSKTAFSIGGLSVSFAALAGIAAGVVAAGVGIYMWCTKDARAAQKAAKAAQQTNNKYKELKQTLTNFNQSMSAYDESVKALEELNKGTEQWNEKLKETNEQVLQLLENYPQLAGAISQNADGLLTIDKQSEAYKEYVDSLNKQVQTGNVARLTTQQTSNEAQRTSLITNAARDIGGLDRASLEKLVGAMQTNGNAIIGNSDYLSKELGLTQQQINAIHDNVDKITTLAATIQNNTKATEILGNTISQDLLKDNSAYQNSEYQEEFAEDISNKLANAQFDVNKYSSYDSDGVQRLDKNAMAQAYAIATGEQIKTTWYGAFKVFNEQTKQWEKISADVVKNEIAAADAINNLDQYIKDTQQTINKASQTFEDLASAALKFRNVNSEEDLKNVDVKQLAQSDVESLNAQDLVDTFGLEIDPDILADWLEKQATLIEKNTRQFIQTLPLGVQDAFKNLDTSRMSGALQTQVANILKGVFVEGQGISGYEDELAKVFNEALGEGKLQELLETNFADLSLDEVRQQFEKLGIQTNISDQALKAFLSTLGLVSTELSAQQIYNNVHSVIDKKNGKTLQYNDEIDEDAYNKLVEAGVAVDGAFIQLTSGMYKFVGDAEQFYNKANQTSLQPFLNEIDETQKKINQWDSTSHSYQDLNQQAYDLTGGGARGYSASNIDYTLVQQQVDALKAMGLATEDQIANWNNLIEDQRMSKQVLDTIQQAISGNKEKMEQYVETGKQALQQDLHRQQLTVAYSQQDLGQLSHLRNSYDEEGNSRLSSLSVQEYTGAILAASEAQGIEIDNVKALASLFMEQADSLDWVNDKLKDNESAATEVAAYLEDLISGVQNLQKAWKESIKEGIDAEDIDPEVFAETQEALSDMFNQDIDTSFIRENLQTIKSLAEGNTEAFDQLSLSLSDFIAQANTDVSIKAGVDVDLDSFNSQLQYVNQLVAAENPTLEVGTFIDDTSYMDAIQQMINMAGWGQEQIEKYLESINYEPNVQPIEVPITDSQYNEDTKQYTFTYVDPVTGQQTTTTVDENLGSSYAQAGSIQLFSIKGSKFKGSSGALNRAGGSRVTPKAPSSGGGGKKGGGGGGKSSTPKTSKIEPKAKAEPTQKKEAPHDPYQQNTKALERQEDLIDDLQDAEKKLLDKDRLKNLEQQNKALEEQTKILQDRLVISQQAGQKNTTAWFAKELQSAFGKNIGFDADGRIADRNKAQAAAVAAYNAAVTKADKEYQAARQKYNANAGKQLTDAQKKQIQNQLKAAEDKKKKAIDKAKEQYDEKTKLLDAYEKRWQEDQKTREQIEKAWQQYYENSILHQQIKIDLKIDSGDFERDWLDFEKKFIKKLDKNDFLGQAKANAKQLASYFNSGQIEAVSQRINSIREQIKKMQEGVTSEIYGNNLAQAREDLETYMKQQMEDLQKIQDLTEEIQQNYLDAIDKAKDKMDEQIDQYERVNSLIDHNVKLTQLLYGDKAYDTMDKYFQKRRENDQAELDSLRKQQLYWQQKMDQETPGSEAWQRFKKNVDDTTDQLNSKLEDMIQNLSDQWENRVDGIIQKLNNALTGGRGLDYLDEQWDYINNYDDKFLDTVESKMGVQDVERLYNNAIDGLAGNPKAQQRINNLMKDQLKILKEKDHLTEYDLERAKAMLQVEQARMDLEDARNNKTKMRLRRDSQGNYTYQYVADEQKLGDLQDALADAQANLYNMDKQHYKQNLNDMYDTYKDYINKMRELTAAYNATQDQEERDRIQARINLLKDSTDALMKGLTEDNQTTLYKYLVQSAFDAMDIDPSSFTQEELFNILRENVPQVQSNIQDLADTIVGEGGLLPATAAYMKQIAKATEEYDQAVQSTVTAAGTSVSNIRDVFGEDGKYLDNNINKAKELVTENNKLIASVDKEITAIQQLLDWLDKYLNKAMNIEEIVRRLRGGFDFYQELKDSDTTAEEIPVTKTPSDTTTGNEYPGSEVNPGNSKSTQDQLAALQTSAEYNGMIAENTEATADAISELQHSTISQPEDIPPIDTNATGLDPESISNAAALGAVLASMLNSLAEQDLSTLQGLISTSLGHIDNVEELNQNVHIEANFPNVNASAQIEAAFVELVNTAAMYTSRYQKG